MLRKILLASIVGAIAYVIGVRAGFSAGVRDYIENDAELLERVAIENDKYDYPEGVNPNEVKDIVRDAAEAEGTGKRMYQ